jgi:hypothetical protein
VDVFFNITVDVLVLVVVIVDVDGFCISTSFSFGRAVSNSLRFLSGVTG